MSIDIDVRASELLWVAVKRSQHLARNGEALLGNDTTRRTPNRSHHNSINKSKKSVHVNVPCVLTAETVRDSGRQLRS